MSQNQSVGQFEFYLTSSLVHNLVHTGLDICGRDRCEGLPLHLWPDVSVTLCHAYRCARRPSKNMSHNSNRRSLLKQLRGSRVPQIMKAQTF